MPDNVNLHCDFASDDDSTGSPPYPFRVLAVGEILWDMLPEGKKVGGAPANFAYHVLQQGAAVRMLSRVGEDALGTELLEYCTHLGLSAELIETIGSVPTGTVDVRLREDGQPVYTIREHVAWDFLEAIPQAVRWASEADAVCFGSLAMRCERNRRTLQTLLDAAGPDALRVLDLNLRDPFCEKATIDFVLERANVLKLNEDELERLAGICPLTATEMPERLRELRDRYDYRFVILTCGAQGSWLANASEQAFTPGVPVEVADTIGAGDAFTAAAVTGILHGSPLREIGEKASRLAAYVCSRNGGTPPIPEHLRSLFSNR